eukprot:1155916-Pelagomonas_calceolata.AAC.6
MVSSEPPPLTPQRTLFKWVSCPPLTRALAPIPSLAILQWCMEHRLSGLAHGTKQLLRRLLSWDYESIPVTKGYSVSQIKGRVSRLGCSCSSHPLVTLVIGSLCYLRLEAGAELPGRAIAHFALLLAARAEKDFLPLSGAGWHWGPLMEERIKARKGQKACCAMTHASRSSWASSWTTGHMKGKGQDPALTTIK